MATTLRVGNLEVMALSDGAFTRPPAQFMPEVPAEAWEQYRAAHLEADGSIRLNIGSFLFRSEGRTILVDTGVGGRSGGPFPPGTLLSEIDAAGIRPEEIEQVLITHMHLDHIGWNTIDRDGRPVPTFPRARYVIQQAEWDYWTAQESAAALMNTCAYPVQQAGQLELVGPEHHPTAALTLLPTPGHTPGHCCVLISSGDEKAIILGDIVHNTVQVTEPDWSVGADVDKPLGRQTRTALWERIEAEGMRVAAGHLAPSFGRFVRLEGRRTWQAL